MDRKKLLIVGACLALIYLLSQLGVFTSVNGFFYSRYQSNALEKQNQFATITIERNNLAQASYTDWKEALEKVLNWSNSDIYLIDFFAEGDSEVLIELTENDRVHFVQSTLLDEDFSLISTALPNNFTPSKSYSINFPNFTSGFIQDYLAVESLRPDVIQEIYLQRQEEIPQEININYMVGQGYLPAVNFSDILENKVDQRLFEEKTVLIVNQSNRIVPTVLSHSRPISQSQYYAYLFETALQDIELSKLSSVPLLIIILIIGSLMLLLSYFLPHRTRLPIGVVSCIGLAALSFFLLGSTKIYLPVVELLLAVILPMYFIQQQDSKIDKEQLRLGTRLYGQILESSGKSDKQQSHTLLLQSFSQFFCTLTYAESINYQINHKNKDYNFVFNGEEIQQRDETPTEGHAFSHELSLFNNSKAKIYLNKIPENSDIDAIESLLKNKEQYLKFLLSELATEHADKSRGALSQFIGRSRYTAAHERFSITTDNFLSHYHLLKSNFESLQTASVLYGVNGEIIQVNQAAELFIRENDVRLFNQSLLESLIQITELEQETIRAALLELANDQDTVVVWPTRKEGFDKGYLVSLSAYTNENAYFGGFLIELLDIDEVNYISSLKNNFISELNNQLRNDFSEVMLAIDFLAMGIEGGLSLEEINQKVIEFSEKLQSSDLMLKTTNDIMRNKRYPVDIRELVAASVKAISEVVDEKQISVNIKQPRFINLVLLDYQHFAQICKQLMLFAVKDCMDEGELSLTINEQEIEDKRFVSIIIKTKGYGIFDRARLDDDSRQNISEISELVQIEKYILNLDGQIELESSVGEGSTISTLLPCFRF